MIIFPAGCKPCFHSPPHEGVVECHDEQGGGVVPAEAHGDEHDVVMVALIPRCASPGRKQHKPDLRETTQQQPSASGALTVSGFYYGVYISEKEELRCKMDSAKQINP